MVCFSFAIACRINTDSLEFYIVKPTSALVVPPTIGFPFPLILVSIFFLATLSFAIDIQLLSERLNYIMTLFLTIVAIQWTITDRLPRVPYLTLIDRLLIITLCTLLLMAAGSVVCHRLIFPWRLGPTTEGNIEAGSIDAAALSASTNPLGQYLDVGILSVSCLLFLGHSVHIVWRKRSKGSSMRKPWTAGTHPHNKRSLV